MEPLLPLREIIAGPDKWQESSTPVQKNTICPGTGWLISNSRFHPGFQVPTLSRKRCFKLKVSISKPMEKLISTCIYGCRKRTRFHPDTRNKTKLLQTVNGFSYQTRVLDTCIQMWHYGALSKPLSRVRSMSPRTGNLFQLFL